MKKSKVALVKGNDRRDNIRRAVELIREDVASKVNGQKVIVKPNCLQSAVPLSCTYVDALRGILDSLPYLSPESVIVAEGCRDSGHFESFRRLGYVSLSDEYDEPEGIFPDGKHTLVECDKHSGRGIHYNDIYKLALDGSGQTERLTFFANYPGYKSTNPVVSDDGRYMAFQYAKRGDLAGVGRGILIFDLEMYEKTKKSQSK